MTIPGGGVGVPRAVPYMHGANIYNRTQMCKGCSASKLAGTRLNLEGIQREIDEEDEEDFIHKARVQVPPGGYTILY